MKLSIPLLFTRMTFLVVLISTAPGLTAAAASDDLVPFEVVTDLVGDDIIQRLPDGFPLPGAGLPASMPLRLIAARDSNYQKEVYLRTRSNLDEFRRALADAYIAGGWTDLSTASSVDPVINPRLYFNLCHDDLGTILIDDNGRTNGENRIVVRYLPTRVPPNLVAGFTCAEARALNEAGYPSGLFSFFMEQVPSLVGPEVDQGIPGSVPSLGIRGISSGSNSNYFRTSHRLELEVPGYLMVQMFVHMSTQLEEQGWSMENHVSSVRASSSIWTKSVQGPTLPSFSSSPAIQSWDMDLTGILTILDQSEDRWLIQFELWTE